MDQRAAKPANETKHLPLLELRGRSDTVFFLAQYDNGVDNGTALWLAGQVLAMALPALLPKVTKGRAIELGSGIGYTALMLASMGWDVVATDTQSVIRSVLQKNVDNNKAGLSGAVQVRELDWTQESGWDDLCGFDLILTADTLYVPHLVEPLLRTLHKLSYNTSTPVFMAIERRDGALLDNALERARTEFSFNIHRVPHKRLAKLVQKACYGWSKEDWSDIELWKLVHRHKDRLSNHF